MRERSRLFACGRIMTGCDNGWTLDASLIDIISAKQEDERDHA